MPLLCSKNYRQMFKQVLITAIAFLSLTATKAQPPKSAMAVYHQGVAFMVKEQYPEAMGSFFNALRLYKNYDSAYFQMGNINVKFNSNDTAIKFYKKALAINPKFLAVLFNLASVYKNTKHDATSALEYYLRAIKIDNANKEILNAITWCYNDLKDYDQAIIYGVKALDVDNSYKDAYGELAYAYRISGKSAEGVEQFKKYFATSPNELPMYYAGLCYIELKDKAGASSMYDELTKISSKLAVGLKKRIDKM